MKSLLLLLVLLTTLPGIAASTPGDAAIRFLQAVRNDAVNLTPGNGTAISAHTSPRKVKDISERLQRLVHDLGQRDLHVGRTQIDGDLAATTIWLDEGHDPGVMQVFPVALVKRGDNWLPAPVLASFENCGVVYNADTLKRTNALEAWMLNQRVTDLAELRRKSLQRTQDRISDAIPRETLASLKPQQTLERFLQACKNRSEYEILGLMGGLETQLPDEWMPVATSLETAVRQSVTTSPWRLLMDPSVLRLQVFYQEDPNDALASIACLDAMAGPLDKDDLPQIQIVHLNLSRTSHGTWRVSPPEYFWNPAPDRNGVADPDLDQDLLKEFMRVLQANTPCRPSVSDKQLANSLTTATQHGKLADLVPLLPFSGEFTADLEILQHAASLWGSIHGIGSSGRTLAARLMLPMDINSGTQHSAISYQLYSARKPDQFELRLLYLKSVDGGWLWNPLPDPTTVDAFTEWHTSQKEHWQHQWRDRLLTDCLVIQQIPANDAPTEVETKALMEKWIHAIQTSNIQNALSCCAILNIDNSRDLLLTNISFEVKGTAYQKRPPTIHGFYSANGWSACSLSSGTAKKPTYPFYPIVKTPKGPRILLEIDLSAASGRRVINNDSLKRIATHDPEAAEMLRQLFESHQKACLDED